jgi:hypothetical protein
MAKVMIYPATYDSVAEAADRAFKLFPLAVKGKTLLIKPNVLRASEAQEMLRGGWAWKGQEL